MMASTEPESSVLMFIGVMGCVGISTVDEHTISLINGGGDDQYQVVL